jgi:hypothetical protein
MKFFVSTFLLFLLLASCGLEIDNARKNGRAPAAIGELLTASAVLDNQSYQRAVDICFALKGKRLNSTLNNLEFLFEIKAESCTFSRSTESVSMIYKQINSNEPRYRYETTRNVFYIDTVETDLNGELSSICPSIFTNIRPMDTEDLGGGKTRQFVFMNGSDANSKVVRIKTATSQSNPNGKAESVVTRSEDLVIRTFDSDAKKIGIVEARYRTEKCLGSNNISILDQKNLGRIQ